MSSDLELAVAAWAGMGAEQVRDRGRAADVAVKDTEALRDLVLALAERQEIADIRSSVVFEHHRRTTIMPLTS